MASPDPQARSSSEADEALDPHDLEALEAAGEVDALLAAAAALRAGKGVPRDLPACFRAYDAAARLGSHEGEYATALFLLRGGGVVPQDEKEAVARLRAAADAGNLPAKVYLANMYEAGVYFRADPEKADVWHRSLARAAGITAKVGSPEYIRAMADQGAGRYASLLAQELPSAQGDALLKRAAAFGWRTPQRETPVIADPVPPPVSSARPEVRRTAAAPAAAGESELTATAPATPVSKADARPRPSRAARPRPRIDWAGGILRFVFLTMFAAAGLAAAHMAQKGAALLVAQGRPVPVVGPHLSWILPGVLAVIVLLPAIAFYRAEAIFRGLVLATLTGVAGALLWGHPRVTLLPDSATQGISFALGGFLVGMLLFGFTRRPRR